MARLLRTQSLGDTVTRQNLYDLINTCSFVDVGVSIEGVAAVVESVTAPTAFTTSTWWWDSFNQLVRVPIASVGGSACSLWLSIGPDSWEVPVYNPGPDALALGSVVSWKTGDAGVHDVEPTIPRPAAPATYSNVMEQVRADLNLRNIAGVLQCSLAAGEWGAAVYRGFGHLLYHDALAPTTANQAYPAVLSTTYTGAVQYDAATYHTTPFCIGVVTCRPQPTDFPPPIPLPAFIWLPINSLTDTGKAG